jgi:tripartite-type tricarboxylate transporter receptor subunit TctC
MQPRVPAASFDIVNGLRPVGKVCVAAFTLAVSPALGVKTLEDFIRTRKPQRQADYASIATAPASTSSPKCLRSQPARNMLHVPFRGESAAATEMAGGRVHMMFMAGAKPFMDGGLLVGLARQIAKLAADTDTAADREVGAAGLFL